MVPNVERGFSFKGVTAYLLHDKREDMADEAAPHPETAERVGFTKVLNFDDGTRTPQEAAKVMALTVRDAERIKRDAGIPLTGGKAEAPPVYHGSLSWAKSEQPTEAQMEQAAHEALDAVGLAVEKGYLTYLVEHTDTEHYHIHFVVCLVHPENGKQANPHRDQPKLQSWARDYERRRGQIFCKDREAKYAGIDRARSSHATPARAAFNDNSRGPAPDAAAKPDRFGRSRERQPRNRQQRPEWRARKEAGENNRAGQEAGDRIKADTAARWSTLKADERAAFTQRSAEASRFYADRKAGREAIFEKYRSALDGVWKPQAGPKQASPDRSRLWESIRDQQATRQQAFEANEKTALGRVRNALTLAGKGSSLFRTARLAVSADERRRVFERGQRAIVARALPQENRQPTRPAPKTPEPKRVQAERVKAMRTTELAAFARDTTTQAAAMNARHEFQMTAEKDARAILSKEIGAAWQQHRAAHGRAEASPQEQAPARSDAEKITRSGKTDRFGRSRERTRQPRQARAARNGDDGRTVDTAPEAQNSPMERGFLSGQFSPPENEQATHAQPEAAQQHETGQEQQPAQAQPEPPPKTGWASKEERDAAINAEYAAREAREAEERERGDGSGGREMTR